jgi:hypothetical protein
LDAAKLAIDSSTVKTLIIACTALTAVGFVAASIAFVMIGKAAYKAHSASAAGSFGLIFLALPALTTIVFIVIATATLTAMGILPTNGCIAIFSSIASFVLGSETQRRRGTSRGGTTGTPPPQPDSPSSAPHRPGT